MRLDRKIEGDFTREDDAKMDDREHRMLRTLGQQGRQLKNQLDKARAQMEKSRSLRDKKLYEDAYRKWLQHVESYRKAFLG